MRGEKGLKKPLKSTEALEANLLQTHSGCVLEVTCVSSNMDEDYRRSLGNDLVGSKDMWFWAEGLSC